MAEMTTHRWHGTLLEVRTPFPLELFRLQVDSPIPSASCGSITAWAWVGGRIILPHGFVFGSQKIVNLEILASVAGDIEFNTIHTGGVGGTLTLSIEAAINGSVRYFHTCNTGGGAKKKIRITYPFGKSVMVVVTGEANYRPDWELEIFGPGAKDQRITHAGTREMILTRDEFAERVVITVSDELPQKA